ncbi:MAG: sugar phosphate nucleotidyltransferase [Bacteroidales bacterium]|jgi:choline kinase|nr:sugar phosphate nucleotidyltransferase [Bacteroidales bacterium]MDD2570076.1 sugar phosphate nucleotidyltransferase [Bacteroidales bacterium]MDD2812809.1 sugar phosphate nucleotidyltransferase [Bacteroidales bacterium]MDD3384853.1 sugar phosphate nucleotidyltransferase [Bacteroidales bacterium]MDD3811490.1 sugar phosphate nucleotidyltransferase [Bacteroidales bacterium]
MELTLLVLAAGMGSRYGSLKQMDRLGPGGESIIDYSVYDAAEAGFTKVVFVLREEIVDDFYEIFANRYKTRMKVGHVVQRLTDIPEGIPVNPDRVKPWGTGHAVLCAESLLNEPFAVINGDDYYGKDAFKVMAGFLSQRDSHDISLQSMVGYQMSNTLSDHGSVSRGICSVDTSGMLTDVVERTKIERKNNQILFTDEQGSEFELTGNEIVSMNFWGFTPAMLTSFREHFNQFLKDRGNELKSEYFIPYGINLMIQEGLLSVKVLESTARWFGVTYQDDKPLVQEKLRVLHQKGDYPDRIW